MSTQDEHANDIAIVGMHVRVPGADDVDAFWKLLRDGREAVRILSDDELRAAGVPERVRRSPRFVGAVADIPGIDLFDAAFFGLSPREAEVMDPQFRLFLEGAWAALEDAGHDPGSFPGPIAVCAGAGSSGYLTEHLAPNREVLASVGGLQVNIANALDSLTTLVSYKLNLTGPSFGVQTACSTSLVAVHLACQSLLSGECDMALAGGVSVKIPAFPGYLHQDGGILSRDGHTRAFDAAASGTVMANGIGIVVLRRIEDALADGDSIRAVIRGSAVNNDGSAKGGYTAPSVGGHARVVAEALGVAGLAPDSIGYVEAHGTGTELGDPIEIEGLTRAFRERTSRVRFCAIGSLKTNVGHLDHAAGIAGLVKTVLALEHRRIPPSLHFETPNPRLGLGSTPFRVATRLEEWPDGEAPRRAAVSSLGIGGTNAHVVLEEAPPASGSASGNGDHHALVLSARSEAALEAATDRLARHLRSHPQLDIGDVAFTLQAGRRRFSCRRAVVCDGALDAARALEARDPERVVTALLQPSSLPSVFLFPGQGAQFAGMSKGLYQRCPAFRRELDTCCDVAAAHVGLDLRSRLFPEGGVGGDPRGEIDETRVAQPALFAVEYALARVWLAAGLTPQAMIGHSIGEYVAACLAGVFSLEDALALVALRGRLMQALPRGAMLAVPLAAEEVDGLLTGEVALAAVNAASSCVVSGPEEAIDAFASSLRGRGVETRRLRTSHAFHSPMMEPVLAPFAEAVARVPLGAPRTRFVSNVTGDWIREEEARDPGYWARHLRAPVRFAEGLARILEAPELAVLEVGPGGALGGLVRQHPARGAGHTVLASLPRRGTSPGDDHELMLVAAARLWISGATIDWSALGAPRRSRRVPLPTYPFERGRFWVERSARSAGAVRGRAATEKREDVGDWLYLPAWKAVPTLRGAAAGSPERWLVLRGGDALGARLARTLRDRGHQVVEARAGTGVVRQQDGILRLDPRRGEDYRQVVSALGDRSAGPLRVLHLWSLDGSEASEDGGADGGWTELDLGFHALRRLLEAMEERYVGEARIHVVTSGLVSLGPGEQIRPERATLRGAAVVIPQEHPHVRCQVLDVAPAEAEMPTADLLVERIAGELEREVEEPFVALRGALRFVPEYEPLSPRRRPAGSSRLRPGGVYLITGGLGRVGRAVARHLSRTLRARLVLTSRSGLPPREQWADRLAREGTAGAVGRGIECVQELESLGSEVLVRAADAAEGSPMAAVIAEARARFGAIHGVIHAAGALDRAGHALRDLSEEECARQLRPKVQGLEVLDRVLEDLPETERPDFVVLMSSLSTVLGGLGYGAYAAANFYMDAFAESLHARGHRSWTSVSWDAWQREPEPAIGSAGGELARLAMTAAEGGAVLDAVLACGPVSRVVVSTADLAARVERWARPAETTPEPRPAPEGGSGRHPRPNLHIAFAAPEDAVETRVAGIWAEMLGIDRVGRHDGFFELGGTSLLAVQLVTRVRHAFDVELPVAAVIEGPTVHAMARLIREGAARRGALVGAESPGQEE